MAVLTIEDVTKGMPLDEFLAICSIDFKFFCEHCMTHDIEYAKSRGWQYEITDFHMQWVNKFLTTKRTAIISPRGSGKTSVLGSAFFCWNAMFKRNFSYMILSKTLPQAREIITQAKNNIMHNELLERLKPSNTNIRWSSQELNTSTGCRLLTNPYNDSVLGKHVNYILLDEASAYEDPTIYFDKVVQCADDSGHIMLIGTPWHEMDLIMRMKDKKKYPDYDFNLFSAVKKDGTSLWETKYSKDKLDFYRRNEGDISFNKNYLCNLISDDVSVMPMNVLVRGWIKGENASLINMRPNKKFKVERMDTKGIPSNLFKKDLTTKQIVEEPQYYGGIDLAQSPQGDYTVLLLVERLKEKINEKPIFKIVYIDRSRGNSPDVHRSLIRDMYDRFTPSIQNTCVDRSQIGDFLINDMSNEGIFLEGFYFSHENRNMLLRNTISIVNQERLIIPRKNGLVERNEIANTQELTDILTKECSQLISDKTPKGMQSYKTVGKHDDVLMALGLALFAASQERGFNSYIRADNV